MRYLFFFLALLLTSACGSGTKSNKTEHKLNPIAYNDALLVPGVVQLGFRGKIKLVTIDIYYTVDFDGKKLDSEQVEKVSYLFDTSGRILEKNRYLVESGDRTTRKTIYEYDSSGRAYGTIEYENDERFAGTQYLSIDDKNYKVILYPLSSSGRGSLKDSIKVELYHLNEYGFISDLETYAVDDPNNRSRTHWEYDSGIDRIVKEDFNNTTIEEVIEKDHFGNRISSDFFIKAKKAKKRIIYHYEYYN